MISFSFLMVMIWKQCGVLGETPYHYISQVPPSAPETLAPKPLFAPHDVRREGGLNRGTYTYQDGLGTGYRYGTDQHLNTGVTIGHNLIYGDSGGSDVYANGQERLWYPVYADVQYPGWLGVSQMPPYDMSFGALPEGYEPRVPLRGDPLGYSFSYNAGDHSRHDNSDGRGNYFSSFSFMPPGVSPGLQPRGVQSNFGAFSTLRPTIDVPSVAINPHSTPRPSTLRPLDPGPYSTVRPIPHPLSPSSPRPHIPGSPDFNVNIPTNRPLIGQPPLNPDFSNGYYYVANNYPSNPSNRDKTFHVNSHPLSTNIQYDSLPGESSSSRTSIAPPTSRRVVTIEPPTSRRVVTIEPPITTIRPTTARSYSSRSYSSISRALPSLLSRRVSTESSPPLNSLFTTTSRSPLSVYRGSRRFSTENPLPSVYFRRYSTENPLPSASFRRYSTEAVPTDTFAVTQKKGSVVQKIPRKPKEIKHTSTSDESLPRPLFIDDLTSLAYSSDRRVSMNDTIIQIKPRRDKSLRNKYPDANEKTSVHEKTSITPVYLKNSTRTFEIINKDGHVTGNRTYLGGLGLRTNIHY